MATFTRLKSGSWRARVRRKVNGLRRPARLFGLAPEQSVDFPWRRLQESGVFEASRELEQSLEAQIERVALLAIRGLCQPLRGGRKSTLSASKAIEGLASEGADRDEHRRGETEKADHDRPDQCAGHEMKQFANIVERGHESGLAEESGGKRRGATSVSSAARRSRISDVTQSGRRAQAVEANRRADRRQSPQSAESVDVTHENAASRRKERRTRRRARSPRRTR